MLGAYYRGEDTHDDVVWEQMHAYWTQTGQLDHHDHSGIDPHNMTEDQFSQLSYQADYGDWDLSGYEDNTISDAEWGGIGGTAAVFSGFGGAGNTYAQGQPEPSWSGVYGWGTA